MEMMYEREAAVTAALAGADGRLSIHGTASLFMDLAERHADLLGFGAQLLLEKGLFWVASKTMIQIGEMPRFSEPVKLETWPLAPGKVTTERQYRITSQSGGLVCGKTVWALVDVKTGRPTRVSDSMPEDLPYLTDIACDAPFPRINYREENFADLAEFRVTSSDIDIGGHMNNTAYLRALSGCFSSAELKERPAKEVCVIYLSPCYEGERIRFRIREEEEQADVAAVKEDGTVAALFRMTRGA